MDYAELSYYRNYHRVWCKANYRQYFIWDDHLTWEPPQTHYYEKALAELTARYDLRYARAKPSLQFTAGYKIGRDYVKPGEAATFRDNMQYTGEIFLPVSGWNDIQLYLRWDNGFDYYNINYQNRMNRIQAGFIAKNF